MARIVIELTNRCNLHCQHCFEERHDATGDLSIEVIEKVLGEGMQCGIDHLSFTGGEPTLHRQFGEIVRRVSEAGYMFSFVSNGSTFPHIYPLLLEYQSRFKGVTFSLDGAIERTHDRQRGEGSYRQVMRAASVCVARDLPFTLNMALTMQNRHEIEAMIDLACRLGSRGLRLGHLMPTRETAMLGLDLSPEQRRETEARVWELQKTSPLPIGMAPGYYSATPFFACGPLKLEEFNLDYQGNLTLCCQLSGYAGPNAGTDLFGNLQEMTLAEACARFSQRVATYLADKRDRVASGNFGELDYFPCWYCVQYLDKVQGLERIPGHPWMQDSSNFGGGKSSGDIGLSGTTSS